MYDEENWDAFKLGRFSDADEKLVRRVMGARFLKRRRQPSSYKPRVSTGRQKLAEHQRQVLLSRTNTVALEYAYTPRKQAVVTAISRPKSRQGVLNVMSYIARFRSKDPKDKRQSLPQLWDGFGAPVEKEEVCSLGQCWNLRSDADNLSKRARTLLAQNKCDDVNALDERERLRNIQAWHFSLSIEENDECLLKPFRAAVRATVDMAFTAEGHEVIWAIHEDHTEHLHAHLVVKAQSSFGRRLHSDIHGDYLHYLREVFANNLRRVGFNYEATRRIDREFTREDILSGLVPLTYEKARWYGTEGLRTWDRVYGGMAVLSVQRVDAIRHGIRQFSEKSRGADKLSQTASMLREELNRSPFEARGWRALLPKRKRNILNDNLTGAERAVLSCFERMFHNPRRALESWRLMASDGGCRGDNGLSSYPNLTLAIWMLRNRPEVLGFVRTDAYQLTVTKHLKEVLKKVRLWNPDRLAEVEEGDVPFSTFRIRRQAVKDRTAVKSQLDFLHHRVGCVWPDTYWEKSIVDASHRTKQIKLKDNTHIRVDQDEGRSVEKLVQALPKYVENEAKPKENDPESTPVNAPLTKPIMRKRAQLKGSPKGRER